MIDEQQVRITSEGEEDQETSAEAHPMESLLDENLSLEQPKRGEIRWGTIARISPNEILVDIGYKSEGVIAGRELEQAPPEELEKLKEGGKILVYIVNPEDRNGNIILSLSRAQAEKDWLRAEDLYKNQDMFEGIVAGFNKGGLIVKVGKVRGFVPASQLVSARSRQEMTDDEEFVEDIQLEGHVSPQERWQQLVGKKINLKVIEIDRARNRLILSERAAMREWRKAQKEKLLSELQEGMRLKGTVISLADFGAFIDLGGADGLVHLSELSWKRVAHPREILQIGQEVKVEVLSVDRERKRIALSLKRTEEDPWSEIENRYVIGQLVEGTITKLVKFGAFARIVDDEDIEGLIHISELSEGRVNHPKEVVREGETLALRIIKIDAERRRLGLSLRRVDSAEYAEEDWKRGLAEALQYEMDEFDLSEAGEPVAEVSEDEALEPEDEALEDETLEDEESEAGEPVAEVSEDEAIEPEDEALEDGESEAGEPVAEVSEDEALEPEDETLEDEALEGEESEAGEAVAEAT